MSYQLNMDRGGYRGAYAICIYTAMRLQLDRLWVLRIGKKGGGGGGGGGGWWSVQKYCWG